MIQYSKNSKDSKNETRMHAIKLGLKLKDKEDTAHNYDISTRKISTKMRVKLCNNLEVCYCTVKSVLLHSSSTWGLSRMTKKPGQYQNNMRNEEVYRVTKTRTLTIYITKARWKL